MNNVIDFQAAANARRVKAAEAEARAARASRIERDRREVAKLAAEAFELDPAQADFVAAAIVSEAEARREANAPRYMPAYCDPANEFRGVKYEATKSLDIAEIAKRVRADIKALGLGAGYKASVRIQRFSGGQSLDVKLAVPEGFKYWSDKAASWVRQFGRDALHRFPGGSEDQHNAEYLGLRKRIENVVNAYNRDNSDSMSDYFDVNFYSHVSVGDAWKALDAEAAAARPDYWADSCYP